MRCAPSLFWTGVVGAVVAAFLLTMYPPSSTTLPKELLNMGELARTVEGASTQQVSEAPGATLQDPFIPPMVSTAPILSVRGWAGRMTQYPLFQQTEDINDGVPRALEDNERDSLPDGLKVEFETIASLARYRPTKARFSQRSHPMSSVPGRSATPLLFCTSHRDNDSSMQLFDNEALKSVPPVHHILLPDGLCPTAIVLRELVHTPYSMMAPPPRFSRRAMRKALKASALGKEERPQYRPTALRTLPVHFILQLRLFHVFTQQHNVVDPSSSTIQQHNNGLTFYNESVGCLIACLEVPYCSAFQVVTIANESPDNIRGVASKHQLQCRLYVARHDEPIGEDSPETVPGAPVMMLAERREFRPSLVDNSQRLVITGGPVGCIVTLDPLAGEFTHRVLEVTLQSTFGKLDHVGYHAKLRGRVVHAASSTSLYTFSMPMRDGVARVPLSARLQHVAGEVLCIEVEEVDANGNTKVVPRAARTCSIVGLPASRTSLHFDASGSPWYPPHMADENAKDSPPTTKRNVSRGSNSCSPLLRATECCIHGFWYRAEDRHGRRGIPTPDHELYTHHDGTIGLKMAPRVTISPLVAHRCIRFVDGFSSVANHSGEGGFPRLVVELLCSVESIKEEVINNTAPHASIKGGFAVALEISYSASPLAYGSIPWDDLAECQTLIHSDSAAVLHAASTHNNAPLPPPIAVNRLERKRDDDTTTTRSLIGISIRAHQNVPFLELQLRCFAAFAKETVIALHLSHHWNISISDAKKLRRLNITGHSRTLINPHRVRSSSWKATHIHASNFKLLLSGKGPLYVSHVVIWAANELLIRTGMEAYIRQFDMSHPSRMVPIDGAAYTNMLHHTRWWSQEQHAVEHHDLWWWMPWDGVSGDFLFAGILRSRRDHAERRLLESGGGGHNEPLPLRHEDPFLTFPSHQLLLEGTYFNRAVTAEFIAVTKETPLSEFCISSGRYPDNEIFPFLTMRYRCGVTAGLRCGGRVSTMLWRDFYYFATTVTLEEVRCSPYPSPFGWKRVRRDFKDSVVEAIEELLLNQTRVDAARDPPDRCKKTWGDIQKEKRALASTFV